MQLQGAHSMKTLRLPLLLCSGPVYRPSASFHPQGKGGRGSTYERIQMQRHDVNQAQVRIGALSEDLLS